MTKETDYGTIEIPHSIVVACPKLRFQFRRAVKCEGCEHFGGLALRMKREGTDYKLLEKSPAQFKDAFALECRHPISRGLQVVED